MDDELLDDFFDSMRQVYSRFMDLHYGHLDAHNLHAAVDCKAQAEAVQEAARLVADRISVDVPAWAKEIGEGTPNDAPNSV